MRFLFAALISIWMPISALAHALAPATMDIDFDGGRVNVSLELALEVLMAGVAPDAEDTADSPEADIYNQFRNLPPAELEAAFEAYRDQMAGNISIIIDGQEYPLQVTQVDIPEVGDTELLRASYVFLEGELPEGSTEMVVSPDAVLGDVILRVLDDQQEVTYSKFMAFGTSSDPISLVGVTDQPFWQVFTNYIVAGFEHILPLGLDHILFVVGLYLLSTRLHPLLWQVSAFTVAHTITLALGMLGIVTVSPAIVEPLIALSIVYVAVENVFLSKLSPWRPVIVFLFGLLHGLGFAGVLTEFGLPKGQFATALIGFNVGVELGQLTVIAICVASFGYWLGNKPWYRQMISIPLSLGIAVIASYWVYERVFL